AHAARTSSTDTIFFFQAEDGIRGFHVTGVQTCALPIFAVPINLVLGCLAAYGLSRFQYRFRLGGNRDITFFFVSQRILPPVVLRSEERRVGKERRSRWAGSRG